jgi:hypothetical protein
LQRDKRHVFNRELIERSREREREKKKKKKKRKKKKENGQENDTWQ